MKTDFRISILLLGLLIHFGCRQRVTTSKTESNTIIPNIAIASTDVKFKFHQDTLYYNEKKYSGYIFNEYQKGDTAFLIGYLNGLEEGLSKKWYYNKQLSELRIYHQGKKIGIHKGYWENGNPKFEYNFLDGEHQGIAKDWYENGQAFKIFHYKMGYEEGSQKVWWENGVIRANYVVKNGRRYGLIGLKLCMNPEDSVKISKIK